jgi:hypothetical protein
VRPSMLQVLSITVASVGVMISAGSLWIAQQRYKVEVLRKRLSYFLSSFSYNGTQHVAIYIWNSGNTPIEQEDFISPLGFTMGNDAEILTARVGYQEPEDLGVTIQVVNAVKLEIGPIYLNPEDRFTLETSLATADDVRDNIRPYGRIRGVHRVLVEEERKPRDLEFGEPAPEEPAGPEPVPHARSYRLPPQITVEMPLLIGIVFGLIGAVATVLSASTVVAGVSGFFVEVLGLPN